jgi:IS5 family transposase
MANLIREDDTAVYGDKGYASEEKKRAAEHAGVLWAVKEKAKPGRTLTKRQRARNRRFGKVRAKVEHVFRVVKCQFGYRKVRYRGIAKNGAQVFALFALANLYLVRRRIAARLHRAPVAASSGRSSLCCIGTKIAGWRFFAGGGSRRRNQ